MHNNNNSSMLAYHSPPQGQGQRPCLTMLSATPDKSYCKICTIFIISIAQGPNISVADGQRACCRKVSQNLSDFPVNISRHLQQKLQLKLTSNDVIMLNRLLSKTVGRFLFKTKFLALKFQYCQTLFFHHSCF